MKLISTCVAQHDRQGRQTPPPPLRFPGTGTKGPEEQSPQDEIFGHMRKLPEEIVDMGHLFPRKMRSKEADKRFDDERCVLGGKQVR